MSLQKLYYNWIKKPLLKQYLKYTVIVNHDGFKLKVSSGVFHPTLFFSTPYFYQFINQLSLNNLQFLEIGSGSGLLSLLAYRKGAVVTSVDKDVKAVNNTLLNYTLNFKDAVNFKCIKSDLFDELTPQKFDVIIINPPYFFKEVIHTTQLAWYCGEDGEYFKKLFKQLCDYVHSQTQVYMILADNCDIERITSLAKQNFILFTLIEQKKIKWEQNFIFKLEMNPKPNIAH